MYSKDTKLDDLTSYCQKNGIALTYISSSGRHFISISGIGPRKRYMNENDETLDKVMDKIWIGIKHIKH